MALEVASGGGFRSGFRNGYRGVAWEGCSHDLSGEFSSRGPESGEVDRAQTTTVAVTGGGGS